VLAVAVVGLAVGSSAANAKDQSPWRSIRPSDAPAVKAALAKLHAPQGFKHASVCRSPVKGFENVCFERPTSIPLSRAETTRLVAASGTEPQPRLGPGLTCILANVGDHRPGLHPEDCAEAGTLGRLFLDFFIESVVRQTTTSVESATQSVGPIPGGTQIDIVIDEIHR
jgi:hypothetical protein